MSKSIGQQIADGLEEFAKHLQDGKAIKIERRLDVDQHDGSVQTTRDSWMVYVVDVAELAGSNCTCNERWKGSGSSCPVHLCKGSGG